MDDSSWLKQSCFANRVHGVDGPKVLPSVAKGGRCTQAFAYPPRHSRRVDVDAKLLALNAAKQYLDGVDSVDEHIRILGKRLAWTRGGNCRSV